MVTHRVGARLMMTAAACALVAAAAPTAGDDLIRAANAAFLRDDVETADRLYAEAEERTADPGLVAFNRAAVHFQRGEFADAERCYARVLDDRDCPPDRAARAWFNRGSCLLRRGGDARAYRFAIICFERCLDQNPPDAAFRAEAEHHLELAKVLWAEANRKAAKPERPSDPPPELPPEQPPDVKSPGKEEPGGNDATQQQGPSGVRPLPQPAAAPQPNGNPTGTDAKTAGNNAGLPVLQGKDADPTTPESAREFLKQTDARLQKRREQLNDVLRGPDRPGVRDW